MTLSIARPRRSSLASALLVAAGSLAALAGAAPAPPSPSAPAPAASAEAAKPKLFPKTLILMRHGQYLEDPAADERLGAGLAPIGVAQARLAGARLAALPEPFDEILASPLTRARDTARVVADDLRLPIRIVEELAECTPPTWRTASVADEKPEEMAACVKTLDRVFEERFRPAEGAERRELLVAHGNVIRYLVTKALKVDTKAWLEMSIGHASLTTIRVAPDGSITVLAVGDTGHIPFNLYTRQSNDPSRSLAVPVERP